METEALLVPQARSLRDANRKQPRSHTTRDMEGGGRKRERERENEGEEGGRQAGGRGRERGRECEDRREGCSLKEKGETENEGGSGGGALFPYNTVYVNIQGNTER